MARNAKIDTGKFIDAWEMEECLWNVVLDIYKDRNQRQAATERLANIFQVSGKFQMLFCLYYSHMVVLFYHGKKSYFSQSYFLYSTFSKHTSRGQLPVQSQKNKVGTKSVQALF